MVMGKPDTTGKALVEHWKWAAEKGLMNVNTANSLRAACFQVMSSMDDWEPMDVTKLNQDDICMVFQNKKSKEFTPQTLDTYKRRFRVAINSFLSYTGDPSAWRGPFKSRKVRKDKGLPPPIPRSASIQDQLPSSSAEQPTRNEYIDYPFPLRSGRLAVLRLPLDLSASEVKRLAAYLQTLVVDASSES